MEEQQQFTGGCLCGGATYVCAGAPMWPGHCHCDNCRKTSGTGHLSWFSVPADSFTLSGEVRSFTYQGGSGSDIQRHFCPTCGSHVYSTHECATNMVMLPAGGLDDPEIFKPQMVIFTSRAPSWDALDPVLPSFPEMPPRPGG